MQNLFAAQGWLELGNPGEAFAELELLTKSARKHPDVLEVEWAVLARLNRWDDCVNVGEALVAAAPTRFTGWIDRSYALHELKRTHEAWELLLPAATKFKKNTTIPYNLACYACVLGNHSTSLNWLGRAMDTGNAEAIKLQALEDPDLAALREEIRRL